MRRAKTLLIAATALSLPGAFHAGGGKAAGQVADHVSFSLGVGLSAYGAAGHATPLGLSVGRAAAALGVHAAFHSDPYAPFGHGGLDFGGYHHPGSLLHCWDVLWFDPFADCAGWNSLGFGAFGFGFWYSPWHFGFRGWPSHRYLRRHGFGLWPFWSDHYAWGYGDGWGFGPRWGYDGWAYDPWGYDRWGYDRWSYGGWGRDPWGWRGWGWGGPTHVTHVRYYDYGGYDRPGSRVVRRSPLYGPRFKEDPRRAAYVTDNGPYRPVSSAVPRGERDVNAGRATRNGYVGDRRGLSEPSRTARPRSGSGTTSTSGATRTGAAGSDPGARTARPRTGVRTGTDAADRGGTDRTGGIVRAPRPSASPRPQTTRPRVTVRPTPTSPPTARQPSTRRPTPTTRQPVTRRPTPTTRQPVTRRPTPTTRQPVTRRPTPSARQPVTRRPTPTVRPPVTRRPTPTTRQPVTRRPTPTARQPVTRRPTPSARPRTPQARPTPTQRPKPTVRSAPTRRPSPSVRPSSRGSSSRPKPTRRPVRRPG